MTQMAVPVKAERKADEGPQKESLRITADGDSGEFLASRRALSKSQDSCSGGLEVGGVFACPFARTSRVQNRQGRGETEGEGEIDLCSELSAPFARELWVRFPTRKRNGDSHLFLGKRASVS